MDHVGVNRQPAPSSRQRHPPLNSRSTSPAARKLHRQGAASRRDRLACTTWGGSFEERRPSTDSGILGQLLADIERRGRPPDRPRLPADMVDGRRPCSCRRALDDSKRPRGAVPGSRRRALVPLLSTTSRAGPRPRPRQRPRPAARTAAASRSRRLSSSPGLGNGGAEAKPRLVVGILLSPSPHAATSPGTGRADPASIGECVAQPAPPVRHAGPPSKPSRRDGDWAREGRRPGTDQQPLADQRGGDRQR